MYNISRIGIFLLLVSLFIPSLALGQTGDFPPKTPTKYSDRNFLSAMIGHHHAKIERAETYMKLSSRGVNTWTREVITSHKEEIVIMEKMLETRGGLNKELADATKEIYYTVSMGGNTDHAFLRDTLKLDETGIKLCAEALASSLDMDVLNFAEKFVLLRIPKMRLYRFWISFR